LLRTFKFRLYPNREQRKAIDFTLERCRLLYNRLLDERIHAYRKEGISLTYYDQANTFNARKAAIPALKQVHSQVLQDVAKRLDKAFQAFFRRVKAGEKAGFPRFKPATQYGRVVKQVNPHHTSPLCSNCGETVKKALSVRIHKCESCGFVADRDENAAKNILQRAIA
jgi:transposase